MTIFFLLVIALLVATGYATGADAATSVATSLIPIGSSSGSGSVPSSGNETGVSVYQSDGSLTGTEITNDPSTWPGSDKIWNICTAVALAEGYNLGLGTAPYDLNNPGDLSPGDEAGQATCGGAQVHDGSAIIVFCTAECGWSALYTKFSNIVNGKSTTYPAKLTWAQVAAKYAGDSGAWLANVTNYLGVTTTSTPQSYVNS
jgi:hypothetical protein